MDRRLWYYDIHGNMKSLMASGFLSLTIHAAVVGVFVALEISGIFSSVEPPDVGVSVVREAGDSEARMPPPCPEIEFDRLEFKPAVEPPPVPDCRPERAETPVGVSDDEIPPPRRPPKEPSFDRPMRPVSVTVSTAAAVVETAPSEISNPPPEYPLLARRRGYEGSVLLAFVVKADGTCGDIRVLETSGHEVLDQAAVRALGGWRFSPATRNGRPVASEQRIRFTFRLQG